MINRRIAHVGDLVELAQFFHDEFADRPRCDLAFAEHTQAVADALDRQLDVVTRNRPFLERLRDAGAQLAFVEWLPRLVILDHLRQHQFRRFKCREALAAREAFAATPDLVAVAREA